MHRKGFWMLAFAAGAMYCSAAFAQRDDHRDDDRDRDRGGYRDDDRRDGDRDRDRRYRDGDRGPYDNARRGDNDWRQRKWDWSQERYRGYENNRRPDFVFGRKSYVDRLSFDLYQQTNSICWEMYRFYQDNRGYRSSYAQMYEIRDRSLHINELVRDKYHRSRHDRDDIERELYDMDRLFHQIEDDIVGWRANSRDAYRGGDLRAKMDICEVTLHDLMEDYGIKRRAHEDQNHDSGDRNHASGDRNHD